MSRLTLRVFDSMIHIVEYNINAASPVCHKILYGPHKVSRKIEADSLTKLNTCGT
jgi:hypothetical protein